MKKIALVIALITIMLFACKKDDTKPFVTTPNQDIKITAKVMDEGSIYLNPPYYPLILATGYPVWYNDPGFQITFTCAGSYTVSYSVYDNNRGTRTTGSRIITVRDDLRKNIR